jgi:hypothetical protein
MAERTKTRAPAHETHIVCNRSDRRGPVLAVAVHSTESQDLPGTTDDLRSIRRWFNTPASQASSLPIQQGNVRNVNGLCVCTKKGVIRHSDVTAAGFGSHTDPGKAFPMDDFLRYGRYYKKNGWVV